MTEQKGRLRLSDKLFLATTPRALYVGIGAIFAGLTIPGQPGPLAVAATAVIWWACGHAYLKMHGFENVVYGYTEPPPFDRETGVAR